MSVVQPVFRALADKTRREILLLLQGKEMTIAEVAENFDMTRAAVKKHLSVLSEGNLIRMERSGRQTICASNPDGITPVIDWLQVYDSFWDARLAALKTAIEKGKS